MLLCAEIGLPSILTGSPSQGKVRQQALGGYPVVSASSGTRG